MLLMQKLLIIFRVFLNINLARKKKDYIYYYVLDMDGDMSSSLFDSFFEPDDLDSQVSKLQISFDI